MEKIEIKVEKEFSLLYEKFGVFKRNQLELAVQELIGELAQQKPVDYIEVLKKIRKNAESKGFTDEILGQILNED